MSLRSPTGGFPGWASGTAAVGNITAPPDAQKNTGWIVNQIPPSSYFNWLDNLSYQWLRHLKEDLNNAETFAVREEFLGPTLTNPGFFNQVLGSPSMTPDFGNTAFGALVIRPPANQGFSVSTVGGPNRRADLVGEARVRYPTMGMSAASNILFGSYGFRLYGASGPTGVSGQLEWITVTAFGTTLTGVRVNPTRYQKLSVKVFKSAPDLPIGDSYFEIDGVRVNGGNQSFIMSNVYGGEISADALASGIPFMFCDYYDSKTDRY